MACSDPGAWVQKALILCAEISQWAATVGNTVQRKRNRMRWFAHVVFSVQHFSTGPGLTIPWKRRSCASTQSVRENHL